MKRSFFYSYIDLQVNTNTQIINKRNAQCVTPLKIAAVAGHIKVIIITEGMERWVDMCKATNFARLFIPAK
jgi:hypothetical protein